VHKGDEPDALAHLSYPHHLSSEYVTEIDFGGREKQMRPHVVTVDVQSLFGAHETDSAA
jgi:hypothetical protein